MKVLAVACNSQYIHTNPALFALSRETPVKPNLDVVYKQWSINMSELWIYEQILAEKPDILAFSLYIWNVDFAAGLLKDLRLLLPHCLFVAGGPEATGHPQDIFQRLPQLELLFLGEGEESWPAFLRLAAQFDPAQDENWQRCLIQAAAGPEGPAGVAAKDAIPASVAPIDFRRRPFLYAPEDLQTLSREKRVIYYESSRGCPYGCSFCASAREPLRERDLDLVLADLPRLAAAGGQIKFIDRTFNANPQRALAICQTISALYRPGLSWHFELAPASCPEELCRLFAAAPAGYFHLEAGVQSLNPASLRAVGRAADWHKAKPTLQTLAASACDLHVDLIAGLPYETPETFAQAFQALHELNPGYLQLGFLKILPGSRLAEQAAGFGLRYSPRPPYQILYTPDMSPEYLLQLHRGERALNAFYNKRRYRELLLEKGRTWPGGALQMYFHLAEAMRAYPSGLSEKAAQAIIATLDQA
ncbi:MAG: DUF4080 domain-containing protein [Firmicutes bacterium]|nr:DUF4080 domain-containing protein [Bacillota bacterium]